MFPSVSNSSDADAYFQYGIIKGACCSLGEEIQTENFDS